MKLQINNQIQNSMVLIKDWTSKKFMKIALRDERDQMWSLKKKNISNLSLMILSQPKAWWIYYKLLNREQKCNVLNQEKVLSGALDKLITMLWRKDKHYSLKKRLRYKAYFWVNRTLVTQSYSLFPYHILITILSTEEILKGQNLDLDATCNTNLFSQTFEKDWSKYYQPNKNQNQYLLEFRWVNRKIHFDEIKSGRRLQE